MTDIVERLRLVPDKNGLMYDDYDDVMEAADLIEALRQEVQELMAELAYHGVYPK